MLSDRIQGLRSAVCLVLAAAFLLPLGSCSRRSVVAAGEAVYDPDGHTYWHPGMERCFFRIVSTDEPEGTKVTSVAYSNESRVNRWGLYIFDSGQNYVASASSSAGVGVQKFLEPGTYTVCAVVNYPVSGPSALDPSVQGGIGVLSDLDSFVPRLEDMSYQSLMMYGSAPVTIVEGGDVEKVIDVRRLVSRIGVKRVSLDWDNPGHALETFTLKGMYLTNALGVQSLRTDIVRAAVPSAKGSWFNAMGYHSSGSRAAVVSVDALISDTGIDAVIADGSSYTTEHYFYPLPNPVGSGEDSRSATWCERPTCLVLSAECGGRMYYYRIPMPVMERNKIYTVEEVIIRSLGSLSEEQDVENAVTVRFGFTTSWTGLSIIENS